MSVSDMALDGRAQSDLPQSTGETADRQGNSNEAALQALVSGTKKRLALIEQQSAPPSAVDRLEQHLTEGVYAVILAVTVSAWTVLGFVVWMPLLVRTTALLAGTIFYVSLFRDHARLAYAQEWFRFAVRFYTRGFDHFLGFYRRRLEPETPVGLFEPLRTKTGGELLAEGMWVVAIWIAAVFAVKAGLSALLGG
jgi:hypothetical protein